MAIKSIIELQAESGRRDALLAAMLGLAAEMADVAGFLGSVLYEVLDLPDTVIEIAEWESTDTRKRWLENRSESEALLAVRKTLATPPRITVLQQAG